MQSQKKERNNSKYKKNIETAKTQQCLEVCNISDSLFDHKSHKTIMRDGTDKRHYWFESASGPTCLCTRLESPVGPSRVSDGSVSVETVANEAFIVMGKLG